MQQQNWWEQYPQADAAPSLGARPVYQELPPQPAPVRPIQERKDQLDAVRTQQEIDEYNAKQERGGLGPDKFSDLQGQRAAIGAFRQSVDTLEQLFTQKIAGPDKGGILGLGGERNVGGYLPGAIRPDNKTFNDASNALINTLAPMLGLTGTELNSLGEIQARFGPMLPNASDSDENIQLKLQQLRKLADDQEASLAAQMGQPAPSQTGGGRLDESAKFYGNPSGQKVQVDDGSEFIRVPDPALSGLNGQVNAMMKQGASAQDFIRLFRSQNIPLGEVMPDVMEAIQWRKQNPGYKGDYSVDVETKLQRQDGAARRRADLAYSPVGAAAIAAGNVVTGNRLDNLVELGGGDGERANLGMAAVREAYPGASLAGDVIGGAGLYGAGRGALALAGRAGAPATGTFAPGAILGDAAMGGYIASGANGTSGFDAPNALLGALTGAGGGVAGRGAINTAGRALSPSGGVLAPAYAEGVKPTMGQRMGGIVNRAEQAFASIPAVGGIQRAARNRAVEDWQAGAFNQALREIGAQLPKGVKSGTQAHAYMQGQFNAAYNRARSGLTFQRDPQFDNDFRAIAQEVAALAPDAQKRFASIVQMGQNKLAARGGVLSGDDYKTLVSTIEKRIRSIRKSPSGDYELADVLEDLTIALDAGARRHSNPNAVAALDAADRGYVMAVLIEEAGRKAGGGEVGEFTGKQLEQAMRNNSGLRSRRLLRGEMPLQDYAAAGVRLGDTMPDSGTPERLMYGGGVAGAMGGAAHFFDPLVASPWVINTLANLPGGKQAMDALISPNRKALDPARRALLKRAYLGGLLAAPAAEGSVAP